jgi:hypothetical protein
MKIPTSLVVGLQSLSLSILVGYVPVVGGNPLPQKGVKEPVSEATRSLHQGTVKGFTDSHGNSVSGNSIPRNDWGEEPVCIKCDKVRFTLAHKMKTDGKRPKI